MVILRRGDCNTKESEQAAMPKTMKVVQVAKPGADFEVRERSIPEPEHNQVRIKVEACGICHSDVLVKEGHWPYGLE